MKELLKYIAKALVDHPEQVEVTELAGKHHESGVASLFLRGESIDNPERF